MFVLHIEAGCYQVAAAYYSVTLHSTCLTNLSLKKENILNKGGVYSYLFPRYTKTAKLN